MGEYVRTEDLTIQQGDDRPFTWPVKDADGQPIDLTGYTVRAQVRTRYHSSVVVHQWSTGDGRAVVANGAVTLKVDDSVTWSWRFGVYDIHLTDPDGRTEVLARGTVTVIPGVTKEPWVTLGATSA